MILIECNDALRDICMCNIARCSGLHAMHTVDHMDRSVCNII